MNTSPQNDIRGVLIAVAGARLLLPNATIAEVLAFAPPSPVEGAPDWLLGRIRWRGWELPLVAFSRMTGLGDDPAGLGTKVVVLKAFGGNPRMPYFAMLTQGFPRLVTVSPDRLHGNPDDAGELPESVHARVRLNEDEAFIPHLEAIEQRIEAAIGEAQAA